ncbi:predicted protein [Thalassiosira pseudonana CCMP1335]|uniref:NIPSNAP domain-containing protein n=1 Tax=Thalassiosira pseudonana TaxID=35128 RepID=B8BZG1_THAPS|nr:predicted protein [Thalassiosira pseudonana CCMP1335]EED93347.1 predicted protein [Thalassiosira pseudonana CCMP1335]
MQKASPMMWRGIGKTRKKDLATRQSPFMSTTSTTTSPIPIVELRQYELHPSQAREYVQSTANSSFLRASNLPLAFFGYPETGSVPLNTAIHLYHYRGGHSDRLEKRNALAMKDEWKKYLGEVKQCMISQNSGIFVEAGLVNNFEGVSGLEPWVGSALNTDSTGKGIVELRKYQLQLGYDTVPKFLELYSNALPSKLNAIGTHPTTQLITVLVSDIGSINTVYEIWKHGDRGTCGMAAMDQSRQASRSSIEWKNGIAAIASLSVSFESTVLKPSNFSPLR